MRASLLTMLFAAATAFAAPATDLLDLEGIEAQAEAATGKMFEKRSPVCRWGVQQVAVAGDGVQGGYGLLITTITAINDAIYYSGNVSIDYPRTTNNTHNALVGVAHVKSYLNRYTKACPDTRLVLLGYSFGGIIMMDTICGRSVAGSLPYGKPLTTRYQDRVVATIIYGDETYVPNQPYDVGNCTTGEGVLPRQNPAGCDAYAPTIQSWCNSGDYLCCAGTPIVNNTHGTYSNLYDQDAAQFARQRYLQSIFG